MPRSMVHVWNSYQRLRGREGGNGFGPTPISWVAIDAFQRVTRRPLTPWEIEAIEMIDNVFLAESRRSTTQTETPTETE